MPQTHQLAAILFADIMGFTAIMQEDERMAMKYREKLKKCLETEVKLYGGRIVKYTGDGALCSFKSAIDSIRAALVVQYNMLESPPVPLRIGIHQADVIFEEDDVFGDGVNIASRLESLALPGSIFISAKVYDDIKNQTDIQTVSLGKYILKNVKEPVEIYAVNNPGLKVPLKKRLEGKGIKYTRFKSLKRKKYFLLQWLLPLLLIGGIGTAVVPGWMKKRTARKDWIPQIQKMVDENGIIPTRAFDLANAANKYIPRDSALLKLWPSVAVSVTFETRPAGAHVFWKDYDEVDGEWKELGTTPLSNIWFPRGFTRVKIEKPGFITIYNPRVRSLDLDSTGSYNENMVKVPASEAGMNIVGLEQHGGKQVGEFLMDKYEVSNKEYKKFVDAGGYQDSRYWPHTLYAGNAATFEQAMALFVDKTGRPGPSTWEAGTFPDGKEDHPVAGVSWFEAMAYAEFAGKSLPTVYHWSMVANTFNTWGIIPKSNFSGQGTVAGGSLDGLSNWGVYDIAGNVREWCSNESNKKGQRFILGGGWNDPTYAYNDAYLQPEMDRSPSNGFRCMIAFLSDTTLDELNRQVDFAFRDYSTEKPVDDESFNILLRQYAYDRSPFNPVVTPMADSSQWRIEKVELDAAYNNERLTFYLFLPKDHAPPYQTVVFFPGSGVIFERKFLANSGNSSSRSFDFILKSGRAVLYPVFKGTFERGDELSSDLQAETKFYRDHVISWMQDISRSLDYLETRKEMDVQKLGYYGYSWGSAMGGIMCAAETRFKAAVFHVGGLMMQKTFPEVDPLNFLPRVRIPVLMLNGKNDTFFPVETSQKPMFKLIGTPEKDKKIIIYEGGHLVPRQELMKESLSWFDKYQGEVK